MDVFSNILFFIKTKNFSENLNKNLHKYIDVFKIDIFYQIAFASLIQHIPCCCKVF